MKPFSLLYLKEVISDHYAVSLRLHGIETDVSVFISSTHGCGPSELQFMERVNMEVKS
jgi:hypothetical protein